MDIIISTDPERTNLIAEVREGTYTWADVRYDDEREGYQVTLYPPGDEEPVVFDLAEARKALLLAKESLVAKGYPDLKI